MAGVHCGLRVAQGTLGQVDLWLGLPGWGGIWPVEDGEEGGVEKVPGAVWMEVFEGRGCLFISLFLNLWRAWHSGSTLRMFVELNDISVTL